MDGADGARKPNPSAGVFALCADGRNYPRSWLIAVSIPGNAIRMPTDRYANVELKPSASVPSIRLWDARIALRSTAVLAEEPIQIRRAILGIAAKVVDVGAAEIAEQQ